LIDNFRNNEFWETLIRWFIDNPMLDLIHIGPIIDYINNQRFTPVDNGDGNVGPPQPNFTMKNRNPETLLAAVEEWHKRLARLNEANDRMRRAARQERTTFKTTWSPSTIPHFRLEEGQSNRKGYKLWTIEELLSVKELQAEGAAMSHCVGSYGYSCSTGQKSIWSMKCRNNEGLKRIATIEISNRTVVQARGKRNEAIEPAAANILQRWANNNNISIGSYVWGRRW
jgi:hypothetical protein